MENPYAAPQSEIYVPRGGCAAPLTWKQILFSFKGRIRRRVLWAAWVGIVVASSTVLNLVQLTFEPFFESAILPINLAWGIVNFWIVLAVTVKRWHDRDKSGWWCMLVFGPVLAMWIISAAVVLNRGQIGQLRFGSPQMALLLGILGIVFFIGTIWSFISCGCLRGTRGPNKYGEDPTDVLSPPTAPTENPRYDY